MNSGKLLWLSTAFAYTFILAGSIGLAASEGAARFTPVAVLLTVGGLLISFLGGRQSLKSKIIKLTQDRLPERFDPVVPVIVDAAFTIFDLLATTGVQAAQQKHGKSSGDTDVQNRKKQDATEHVVISAKDLGFEMRAEEAATYVEAAVKREKDAWREQREKWALRYAESLRESVSYKDTDFTELLELGRAEFDKREMKRMQQEMINDLKEP